MRIPSRLKVGGRDYEVDFPHIFKDSAQTLYGLHDPSRQIIYLAQKDEQGCDRHKDSIIHTFLHEVLHAIDNVYNGGRLNAWKDGEETVDQMAEGLIQVFRDNRLDLEREGEMACKGKGKKKGKGK